MNLDELNRELLLIIPEIESDFNVLLNSKKLDILSALRKTCSTSIIKKIVHENPFLLSNALTQNLSLSHCDYDQQAIVNKINEELRPEDCSNLILYTEEFVQIENFQTPLHMVTVTNQNEDLYKNVQLLITCGADVNIKNKSNETPLHVLCGRIDDNMVVESLRFVLERGTNAVAALQHENSCFILDTVICTTKSCSKKLEAMKLLFKFGAKPDKDTLIQSIGFCVSNVDNLFSIKIIKLSMQYLLISEFQKNFSKLNKLITSKKCRISELCKMLDLDSFFNLRNHGELVEYRNILAKELVDMILDKIDGNRTLFSFIADRCSSGLIYYENEELLLYQVLPKLYSKHYVSCQDLVHASIKRKPLLHVLFDTTIFAEKPSSDRVILDPYTVLYLASYLSKDIIMNLIQAYWIEKKERKIVPVKRCLPNPFNNCFFNEMDEDHSSLDDLYNVMMPLKRVKLCV